MMCYDSSALCICLCAPRPLVAFRRVSRGTEFLIVGGKSCRVRTELTADRACENRCVWPVYLLACFDSFFSGVPSLLCFDSFFLLPFSCSVPITWVFFCCRLFLSLLCLLRFDKYWVCVRE